MSVKLVLECPDGWRYQEDNQVRSYFRIEDATKTLCSSQIVELWNAYWDAIDPIDVKLPAEDYIEAHMLHAWCRLHINREYMLVNASESYTMDDFAADLEGLLTVPIVCIDGEESLMRGKERVV